MTTVQLGLGAYKRKYAGAPTIQCLNRWVEKTPDNPKEQVQLLTRPGTTPQLEFSQGSYTGDNPMRGNYTLQGLFDDSLFVVCGENLYRVNLDGSFFQISGVVNGDGHPEVTWQKGDGYERLWIADGLLLQYYSGTTPAHGTLTGTGTTQTVQIGTTFYKFSATVTGTADGTSAHPWLVLNTGDTLNNLILAIMAAGIPGTTYSAGLVVNNLIMATADTNTPVVTVTLTALLAGSGGNSYQTLLTSGTGLTFSGTTLSGGGIDALQGCTLPDGVAAKSVSEVSSYVLVSVADSQRFYWVNPGEVVIDPLNFATKESSPDNIIQMRTVGDQVLIMGNKSTENWYATGNIAAPFEPIQGRVYQRGILDGTPVVIDEGVIAVGDDGRVYTIGYTMGPDVNWGINRISDNGIEERIRRQMRREAGLTP